MKKLTTGCHGKDTELRRSTLGRRLNTADDSNVTCQWHAAKLDAYIVDPPPTTTPFTRVSTDD